MVPAIVASVTMAYTCVLWSKFPRGGNVGWGGAWRPAIVVAITMGCVCVFCRRGYFAFLFMGAVVVVGRLT